MALVVSIDNPVAEDSDVKDELNNQPPTISTQQEVQNLKELNTHFDANAGTFSEAEITFMQGLTSKTQSLRANWQVQSAIPFPRILRSLQSETYRDVQGCFRFLPTF